MAEHTMLRMVNKQRRTSNNHVFVKHAGRQAGFGFSLRGYTFLFIALVYILYFFFLFVPMAFFPLVSCCLSSKCLLLHFRAFFIFPPFSVLNRSILDNIIFRELIHFWHFCSFSFVWFSRSVLLCVWVCVCVRARVRIHVLIWWWNFGLSFSLFIQ